MHTPWAQPRPTNRKIQIDHKLLQLLGLYDTRRIIAQLLGPADQDPVYDLGAQLTCRGYHAVVSP
jgi:hypothetical protein